MQNLKFDNGVASHEMNIQGVGITVLALSAILTLQGSFEKKVMESDIIEPRVQYDYISVSTDETIPLGKYNDYGKENNLVTIYSSGIAQRTVDINTFGVSIQDVSVKNLSTIVTEIAAGMHDIKIDKEETLDMNQKLINHRDTVEKQGSILGLLLGFASLTPSLFFMIDWAATLPASLMFFSLTFFIFMRRQLRGEFK